MADGRRNNGGTSNKGAGRKPKADEIKLAEKIRNVIKDDELLNILAEIARDEKNRNRMKAVELLTGYLYGRPTQRVENKIVDQLPEIHFTYAKPKGKD